MYKPWIYWLTLITGFIVGMLSAFSWKIYNDSSVGMFNRPSQYKKSIDSLMAFKLEESDFKYTYLPEAVNKRTNSVTLTCFVFIKKPKYLSTVNQTWTSRCNRTLFYMASKDLPANLSLPLGDDIAIIKGSSKLSSLLSSWKLLCLTLLGSNLTQSEPSSDWFIIAPQNTFFILENLRHYLVTFNSSSLLYFGLPMNSHSLVNYNAFDSGIVLSHRSYTVLIEAIKSSSGCNRNYLPSIKTSLDRRVDVAIAQILETHHCKPEDTRDKFGRARFLALSLGRHVVTDGIPFEHPFWQNNIYPFPNGPDCCSDNIISIPGLTMNQMRFYNYLIYTLKVVGRTNLIVR